MSAPDARRGARRGASSVLETQDSAARVNARLPRPQAQIAPDLLTALPQRDAGQLVRGQNVRRKPLAAEPSDSDAVYRPRTAADDMVELRRMWWRLRMRGVLLPAERGVILMETVR
jgi:hypothetical protein